MKLQKRDFFLKKWEMNNDLTISVNNYCSCVIIDHIFVDAHVRAEQ